MILQYARLAGIIVGAIALAYGWVTVQHWRDDSRALATVKAQAAQEVAQARQAVAALERAQRAANAASEGYIRELEELRSRPAVRRIVRVCVESSLPAASPAPGDPHGAAEAPRMVPTATGQGASRDIGPDLTGLMVEADRCSAQLRALQSFIRATASVK